jgi:undecaprenyl-phosphate 4-deoxy-4-formamido-L-arabinose transferase
METSTLSVVIPVYQSETTLRELFQELKSALEGSFRFEVIFVNDGSTDKSWKVLQELKRENPEHITAINFARNYGQHYAIACGLSYATGEVIVTMDDDLQHPPKEILKMFDLFRTGKFDLVYGIYADKMHPAWRNAGSAILREGSKLTDNRPGVGSSFRMMTKELGRQIAQNVQIGYLFIDEVIHWYTHKIGFTNVDHHPRRSGTSTYTGRKLFTMYFDIMINYSAVPLKAMTWIGILSSLVTFVLGLRFLLLKLFHPHYVLPGFTATIVAILFSTSILMLSMGIVGQYLYKLYQIQNRKPAFQIKEII